MLENLLSIRVLSSPQNRERAEELAKTLNCSIVWCETDDDWVNTRKALTELSNDRGEFGLFIRDDTVLCENFVEEVQKLIIRTYHYRTIYQLHTNGSEKVFSPSDIEFGKDKNYIFTRDFTDGSPTIVPRILIKDIVRYGNQSFYVGGDTKMRTFLLRYAIPITYPYPELCETKK